MNTRLLHAPLFAILLGVMLTCAMCCCADTTTRVSVSSNGAQAQGSSKFGAFAFGGSRYIEFMSTAANLVAGDTNGIMDPFQHDRQTGETTQIKVRSEGLSFPPPMDELVLYGFIDNDCITFCSKSSKLVAGDTNGCSDVFIYDRHTEVIKRVTVTSTGAEGNGDSYGGYLTQDHRFVFFESYASNLVANDTNNQKDIFCTDLTTGQVTRVNVASDGAQANGDSTDAFATPDGRYLAFESDATNLVPNDTNGSKDIFLRDRQTGTTSRISVASDGTQANGHSWTTGGPSPNTSANGQLVVFASDASNLVAGDTNGATDIFYHDMKTGKTALVSVATTGGSANGSSDDPYISQNGRYVVFSSNASNLVAGDTNGCRDCFMRDLQTGVTTRVSVGSDGKESNAESTQASISDDGRYIVFQSDASSLVANDNNNATDIFVRSIGDTPKAQPDLWLQRTGDTLVKGDNVYDDLTEQTQRQFLLAGATASYTVTVQNDDTTTRSVLLITQEQGDDRWRVIYRSGGQDITAAICGSGFTTEALAPGATTTITVDIISDPAIPQGEGKGVQIQAVYSATDHTIYDAVRAIGIVWNVVQPDLTIQAPGDATPIGLGDFNNWGQIRLQSIKPGETAIYQMCLHNAGNIEDQFLVKAPADKGEWTLRYYNNSTGGTEITNELTGTGITTPKLAPGAEVTFRLEATLAAQAQWLSPKAVAIVATSVTDPTHQDMVMAKSVSSVRSHFWMAFDIPWPVRRGRDATGWITYGNNGDSDMPAPTLLLHNLEGTTRMRLLPEEAYVPGPLQFMAANLIGNTFTLKAGSTERIPFYFFPEAEGGIHFNLGLQGYDQTPIDWGKLETQIRPEGIADAAWTIIQTNLQQQLGTTWSDYRAVMLEDAKYLAQCNAPTTDLRDASRLEAKKAGGACCPQKWLAATTDRLPELSAAGLMISRLAPVAISQRFKLGPFGYGWTVNDDYRLTKEISPTGAMIIIRGPDGSQRIFTRRSCDRVNGAEGWLSMPGDSGCIEASIEHGGLNRQLLWGYTLTEKSGLRYHYNVGPINMDSPIIDAPVATISYPNAQGIPGNSNVLSYSYDVTPSRKLTSITYNANKGTLYIRYNAQSRIAQIDDGAGHAVTYQYDAAGDYLLSVQYPDGRTMQYDYVRDTGSAALHALTTITFPDGTHLYYTYDVQGCLSGFHKDSGLEPVTYMYGAQGIVQVKDALGSITTLKYGANGEILEQVDAHGKSTKIKYDKLGNVTGLVAPDTTSTQMAYDSWGNVTGVLDANGSATDMNYDYATSNLAWLRDARRNETKFVSTKTYPYNYSVTSPDGSIEKFDYDLDGNITTATDRRGLVVNATYDDYHRVTRQTYPSGRSRSYRYDTHNNLLSVADTVAGTITMQYNTLDLLSRIDYPGGRWFTFEYDAAGRRTKRTEYDGYVQHYTYNTQGRLVTLTDGNNTELVRYAYDAAGQLAKETKSNGVVTTYAWDPSGWLLSLTHTAPDGRVQARFVYTYDDNGQPITMSTLDGDYTYTYDAIRQLTGVTCPDGRTVTYAYDAAGNRTTVTDNGVVTAYTANNLNAYTAIGPLTLSYDAGGNLLAQTNGVNNRTSIYNELGQLTRVTTPDGVWEYEYDALGNRSAVVGNGQRSQYLIDPVGLGNVATEYDTSGALTARFVYGDGLVGRISNTGAVAYYQFDGTGNTVQMTDATSAIRNTYRYLPFGECTAKHQEIANPFTFNGALGVMHEADEVYYMRARYYDAAQGRFIAPDPLGINGGFNAYAFTNNSPVKYADPLGLSRILSINSNTRSNTQNSNSPSITKTADGLRPSTNQPNKTIFRLDPCKSIHRREGCGVGGGVRGSNDTSPSTATVATDTLDILNRLEELSLQAPDNVNDTIEWSQSSIEDELGNNMGGEGGQSTNINLPGDTGTITSHDPNELVGPAGYGPTRAVAMTDSLHYTIYFENSKEATAPAQEVYISSMLDANLDWSTFTLGEVVIGSQVIPNLAGSSAGTVTVPLKSANLLAEINFISDVQTGHAYWSLRALDPQTDDLPGDPLIGLLQPNDDTGRGEGHVTFTIKPRTAVAVGTPVTAQASIVFDNNDPIVTNVWRNVIGGTQPDALIKLHTASVYAGDGLYGVGAAIPPAQQVATATTRDTPAIYDMQFQQDGTTKDTLRIAGTADGEGWTVRYFDAGGAEVTSAVNASGWQPDVAPNAPVFLRVEVTPSTAVREREQKVVTVTAISLGDPKKQDAVQATTTRAFRQPDLLIQALGDYPRIGDNIYNTSGHEQARTQEISRGVKATYLIIVQNDGSIADNLMLTGTPGGNGWTVRYFNAAAKGADITTDMTGRGWALNNLATTTPKVIRVEVTAGALARMDCTLYITATSDGIVTSADTVKAITTLPLMKGVTLTASLVAPRTAGTLVTLTATPAGGNTPVYKFMNGDTILRDYATTPVFTWRATTGTATLKVLAKDLAGADPTKIYSSAAITYTVTPSLTAVSLATTPIATCTINTPVSLAATATGGANLVYAFTVNGKMLRDYTAQTNFTWTPAVAGRYMFQVNVKDLNGAVPAKIVSSSSMIYTVTAPAKPRVTGMTRFPDASSLRIKYRCALLPSFSRQANTISVTL